MPSPTDDTPGSNPRFDAGGSHAVQFYDDSAHLCELLADFSSAGLEAGEAVVLIATEPHRLAVLQSLSRRGIDTEGSADTGRLVFVDAREALAGFMVDGMPSQERFASSFGKLMTQVTSDGRQVRLYGEMADVLWRDGNHEAAIRLEEMGNAFLKTQPIPLLCGYAMDNFVKAGDGGDFRRVCDLHADVRPAESYRRSQDEGARLREVARLQQRARALEHEIAQRNQLEIALRGALEREQEAHRAKDQFLAMLGHELRNPLGVVVMSLEVMAQKLGDAGASERGLIKNQVQLLIRLVDDLLDAARLTHGKVELKKEPLDLSQVVARATEMARPLVESKRHALQISLGTPDVVVDGDKLRLAQALGNVVTNAAKYTGAGGTLQITSETRDGRVLLHIADNGIGIEAELLPRVFDAFVQGKRSLDRSEGGLGMGLAVAKRLIELHDGTITALSDGEGRGSAFTISLPHVAGASRAPSPPPTMAAAPRAAKPLKVLVVDDNVDAAQAAGSVLRLMGHEVTVVYDAVAALSTPAADVGVLDIGLPGMDGYDLARRIRALGPKTFLVALTGYGEESHRTRSREAGFDAHMVKPIDPEVLRDLLDRARTAASPE